MDSVKTKSNEFTEDEHGHCIGSILCVPEKGKIRVYLAWEWDIMARKGFFGFMKSHRLYDSINEHVICEVCDYGLDISRTGVERKLFAFLF